MNKFQIILIVFLAIIGVVLAMNFYLVRELWNFMKVRKKWWLLPLIVMLVLLTAIIIFAASTPLSPFIYAFI